MAKLTSNLTKIAGQTGAAAQRALLQTGADIVSLTKQITPVDTGALKQSYGALPISTHEVHVGSDMPYAPHVEFGTVNMSAQAHLTPAFAQSESTFRKRLQEEMEKITR